MPSQFSPATMRSIAPAPEPSPFGSAKEPPDTFLDAMVKLLSGKPMAHQIRTAKKTREAVAAGKAPAWHMRAIPKNALKAADETALPPTPSPKTALGS